MPSQSTPKSPIAAGNGRRASSGRERILTCFAQLVAERGYGHTSIADVAEAAGVSKGTVVHHFAAKERMLSEVMTAFMERRLAEADRLSASFETPYEQLVAFVYALLLLHREDRVPARAFMREFTLFAESEAMKPVRVMREDYQSRVSAIIRRGVEEGAFRPCDVSLTTLQIFGMCNYAWSWYQPGGPHTVIEIAGTFLVNLLGGLSAAPTSDDALTTLLGRVQTVLDAPALDASA